MAILNKVLTPMTGLTPKPVLAREMPYVDDIFDPLFNKKVVEYNRKLYGNRILGTLAGYGQMWDNALLGKKGILGPGMGILSTFGRSMDKADDLPLGILTEGVKAIGQPFGTTNSAPTNPLTNIFANDYNYEGTKLLAAMTNNMAKLAGTTRPLTEKDFSTFGDRLAGLGFDLGLDPGIAGGVMMRNLPNTAAGNVGAMLNNYDDFMAKAAGNIVIPGGQHFIHKHLQKIRDLPGANSSANIVDAPTDKEIENTNIQSHLEQTGLKSRKMTQKEYANVLSKEAVADLALPKKETAKYYDSAAWKEINTNIAPNIKGTKAVQAHNARELKNFLPKTSQMAEMQEEVAQKELTQNFEKVENERANKLFNYTKEQLEKGVILQKPSGLIKDEDAYNKAITSLDASRDTPILDASGKPIIEKGETYETIDVDYTMAHPNEPTRYITHKTEDKMQMTHNPTLREILNQDIDNTATDRNEGIESALKELFPDIPDEKISVYDAETGYLKGGLLNDLRYAKEHEEPIESFIEQNLTKRPIRRGMPLDIMRLKGNVTDDDWHITQTAMAINKDTKDFIKNINTNLVMPSITKENQIADIERFYNGAVHKDFPTSIDPNKFLIEKAKKNGEKYTTFLKFNELNANQTREVLNLYKAREANENIVTKMLKFPYLQAGLPLPNVFKYTEPSLNNIVNQIKLVNGELNGTDAMGKFLNPELVDATDAIPGYKEWVQGLQNKYVNPLQGIHTNLGDNDALAHAMTIDEKGNLSKTVKRETYDLTNVFNGQFSINPVKGKDAKGKEILYSPEEIYEIKNKIAKDINDLNIGYGLSSTRKVYGKEGVQTYQEMALREPKRVFVNDYVGWKTKMVPVKAKLVQPNAKKIRTDMFDVMKVQKKEAEIAEEISKLPPEHVEQMIVDPETVADQYLNEQAELYFSDTAKRFQTSPSFDNVRLIIDSYDRQNMSMVWYLENSVKQIRNITHNADAKWYASIEEYRKIIDQQKEIFNKYPKQMVNGKLVDNPKLTAQIEKLLDAPEEMIKADDFVARVSGNTDIIWKGNVKNLNFRSNLKNLIYNIETVNAKSKTPVIQKLDLDKLAKHVSRNGELEIPILTVKTPEATAALSKLADSKAKLGLRDIVTKVGDTNALKDVDPLIVDYFTNLTAYRNKISTAVGGLVNENPIEVHRVMRKDKAGTDFWVNVQNRHGIDSHTSALQSKAISDSTRLNKDIFGSIRFDRAYLGGFKKWKTGFDLDLERITNATFADSITASTEGKSLVGVFYNKDNLVSEWFKDPKQLADALRKGDNMNNIGVYGLKFDTKGKILDIKRYDAFSDTAMEKAFNDPYAVLLPDNVVGRTSKLINDQTFKIKHPYLYFLNRKVTQPIKFGILTNFGFLFGNAQDASFKQIEEMATKYGTSKAEEASKYVESLHTTTNMLNTTEEVVDKYRKWLETSEAMNDPLNKELARIAHAPDTGVDYTVIMRDPKFTKGFMQWVDFAPNLSKTERDVIKINITLDTYLNNGNWQDVGDAVNNAIEKNPFEKPANKFDSAVRWMTQDNAYSQWVFRKNKQMEELVRKAMVLNDMSHQGYDIPRLAEMLSKNTGNYAETRRQLYLLIQNGIDSMNAANFDYDKASGILRSLQFIMPFPTFYVKNIAYWADKVAKNPQMVDNIVSFQEGMWSGRDTSKDEFAAEAKGRGAIPIGSGHLKGIVKQTPQNSLFGAFNALNNFRDDFTFRTNPMLRPIVDKFRKPEDVKYRPYNTDIFQKNIKKGDKDFSQLAYMFHQLNPYERTVNTYLRTPKKISNNTYQLSDFVPSVFQPDFGKK